ncbi:hypothetical protein IKH79_00695 [Candidatus Saccharibacteria bacterium]|nr:hypothetical protein [Candidatus Saccharibacteria bacterium]
MNLERDSLFYVKLAISAKAKLAEATAEHEERPPVTTGRPDDVLRLRGYG